VVSAALSHSRKTPAKVGLTESGRGRGDRDVRGSIARGRRGNNTPTLAAGTGDTCAGTRQRHTHPSVSSTIRRSVSSAVKALGPPVKPFGAQTPKGAHAVKAAAE